MHIGAEGLSLSRTPLKTLRTVLHRRSRARFSFTFMIEEAKVEPEPKDAETWYNKSFPLKPRSSWNAGLRRPQMQTLDETSQIFPSDLHDRRIEHIVLGTRARLFRRLLECQSKLARRVS